MKASAILLTLGISQATAFAPTLTSQVTTTTSLNAHEEPESTRRALLTSLPLKVGAVGLAAVSGLTALPQVSEARLDPVNRPDLLPTEAGVNVIQVEKFLTGGQVKRMETLIAKLEKDTGFRLRVLCQVRVLYSYSYCILHDMRRFHFQPMK